MGVLGILLFSSLAWAAVGDVPPLPPQDSAAHHYQLDVASQPASLEPVGRATRRLMQAPASCQFAPDAEPWCSEIPPHLCDEASELGLVFRSHCATTCQICKVSHNPQRLPTPAGYSYCRDRRLKTPFCKILRPFKSVTLSEERVHGPQQRASKNNRAKTRLPS